MTGRREMAGAANLEGHRINRLRVGNMVRRSPQPYYETTCEICGCKSTASQRQLSTGAARCLSSDCGKPSVGSGRDLLREQRRQIAERENQRRADELAASFSRMTVETEGWEMPTKYAPAPEPYQPMTERERLARRTEREQREAEERAERERIETPIREAEAQFKENYRKLSAVYRERLLGKVKDPDRIPVDPELSSIRLSWEQADKYNREQFCRFRDSHPEVHITPELIDNLGAYWATNKLQIISSGMIAALVGRYRDAGLLPDPPAPEPEPEPESQPAPEPAQPTGPKVYVGRDWGTGAERTFTEREVARMTSSEYRRAFPVAQNIAELLTEMNRERSAQ